MAGWLVIAIVTIVGASPHFRVMFCTLGAGLTCGGGCWCRLTRFALCACHEGLFPSTRPPTAAAVVLGYLPVLYDDDDDTVPLDNACHTVVVAVLNGEVWCDLMCSVGCPLLRYICRYYCCV